MDADEQVKVFCLTVAVMFDTVEPEWTNHADMDSTAVAYGIQNVMDDIAILPKWYLMVGAIELSIKLVILLYIGYSGYYVY